MQVLKKRSKHTPYSHCYVSAVFVLLTLYCLLSVVCEQRRKEVLYSQVRVFPLAILNERMLFWRTVLFHTL